MVINKFAVLLVILGVSCCICSAEQAGGIRGYVEDKDFDAPVAEAQVLIAETGEKTKTAEEGNYVFSELKPGTYTLIFSKQGYTRQVKTDVAVSPGRMSEVNVSLSGDFTEMEEFVVQDLSFGAGTELALLDLRMEAPALMDSVSSELMSQAGASDAASALKLVSGTTVQDGKYAVVRGLPDRYVNSQMNGVRLPTADADKRAVQLDQFPSAVIESIQVSKTFTPDQQGDASGGAVNVVLKGIPEETSFKFGIGYDYNSNVFNEDDFLSYDGGGLDSLGNRSISVPSIDSMDDTVGTATEDAPQEYSFSLSGGGKHAFAEDVKIGGFLSANYKRSASYKHDMIDDKYWVEEPGEGVTPRYNDKRGGGGGGPGTGRFETSLFDVKQASQQVQWSTLATLGLEIGTHKFNALYMYTKTAEDSATVSEDTRGRAGLHQFWPDAYGPEFDNYDPYDEHHPANDKEYQDHAAYQRHQTLEYTERTTETIQFSGDHKFEDLSWELTDWFSFKPVELDWVLSRNTAAMHQPDKRMFSARWTAPYYVPYQPPTFWPSPSPEVPAHTEPGRYEQLNPAANMNMGNFQRTWKDIIEESDQYSANIKLPFEQWTEDEGYFKFGIFNDDVTRDYQQNSFTNDSTFVDSDPGLSWDDYWSDYFDEPLKVSGVDIDFIADQQISAFYYMADVPLNSQFKLRGGARFESTELSSHITDAGPSAQVYIPQTGDISQSTDGAEFYSLARAEFEQDDTLPSFGFEYAPFEKIKVRGSYSETVARQTFKELVPITNQDYLGGDIFIGNKDLQMSALENYDLRFDYTPYEGGLVSATYFHKDITDPIEYVQGYANFTYTYPVNYPEGEIDGFEFEIRHELAEFFEDMEGVSVGANATFINSEVTLPDDEAAKLDTPNIQAPMKTRDMTNAPEYLYNLFLTWDFNESKTQFGLFYTVRGDTLVAGASQAVGNYLPNVYEKEYGTLNMSLKHKLNDTWSMNLKAKNLLDPEIESVYRSDYIDGDVTKTSYTKGIDLSVSLSARF
ncbi:TonB-dependent receptor [Sedimentisphaera cyanobacteriorum]|uniref:TonB-dependent receptor n=1 Tax=Sedimentisphaera cyanobacteriorum TaxID=1940790 RepID=A0A1Q2HR59_9BACT|nr:TonB-dependent receptor [Sedimentisphaera cyanobacteriorum]AQQ09713.1 TonB-dependent receptor [Sedimentisphaera cyanobacteriorum]